MKKTIFNLMVASLLLVFIVGCSSGGGGSSSQTSSTSTASTNTDLEQTTSNLAPVADAGPDQTVNVGNSVNLDGTGSYDPDENYPLTYEWQIISNPDGSTAAASVSGSSDPIVTFTVDLPGEYTIELVVTDNLGMESEPYVVVVSTSNSIPVADAGPDQALADEDTTIVLDGSRSFDPDGGAITYAWSIVEKPPWSSAVLTDPTAVNPTFVADILGTYVVELIVTDDQGLDSYPDEVVITSENVKPVADPGGNQVVLVGDTVSLDGSGSYDANLDPLTYHWNMVFKPKDSVAVLIGSHTVNPSFEPDIQGMYTLNLLVNDGYLDSDPAEATILAVDAENLDDFIRALMNAVIALNGLDASDFNNENNRDVLTKKIIVVLSNYLKGEYDEEMLDKLRDDIGGKMDGCANEFPSIPDQNDWIMNCAAQAEVYQHIELAISKLEDILNVQ